MVIGEKWETAVPMSDDEAVRAARELMKRHEQGARGGHGSDTKPTSGETAAYRPRERRWLLHGREVGEQEALNAMREEEATLRFVLDIPPGQRVFEHEAETLLDQFARQHPGQVLPVPGIKHRPPSKHYRQSPSDTVVELSEQGTAQACSAGISGEYVHASDIDEVVERKVRDALRKQLAHPPAIRASLGPGSPPDMSSSGKPRERSIREYSRAALVGVVITYFLHCVGFVCIPLSLIFSITALARIANDPQNLRHTKGDTARSVIALLLCLVYCMLVAVSFGILIGRHSGRSPL